MISAVRIRTQLIAAVIANLVIGAIFLWPKKLENVTLFLQKSNQKVTYLKNSTTWKITAVYAKKQ